MEVQIHIDSVCSLLNGTARHTMDAQLIQIIILTDGALQKWMDTEIMLLVEESMAIVTIPVHLILRRHIIIGRLSITVHPIIVLRIIIDRHTMVVILREIRQFD